MQLQNELDFILFADALKNVERRNFNADNSRRENTAEHSWQIILLAQLLFPYAEDKENIDLLSVIRMLSIHDMVEIAVGDTFIFDDQGMEGKYDRERLAAIHIFGKLNSALGSTFLELWLEFEAGETANAVFANAVDRMMPFILNTHTTGTSWTEALVTETQIRKRLEDAIVAAGPAFAEVFYTFLDKGMADGKIIATEKTSV